MIERTLEVVTLLAGQSLDCSTGAYNISDMYVESIISTGVSIDVAARTKENEAGELRDHAVNGVFSPTDGNCPTYYGSVLPGPFDKVYVKSGSTAVRCILKSARGGL